MKKIKICLMLIFCLFLTGCNIYTINEEGNRPIEKKELLNGENFDVCIYEGEEYLIFENNDFYIEYSADELIQIGYVATGHYFTACKAYKIKGNEDFIVSDDSSYVKKEFVIPKFEEVNVVKIKFHWFEYYDSICYSYEKEIDLDKNILLKDIVIQTVEPEDISGSDGFYVSLKIKENDNLSYQRYVRYIGKQWIIEDDEILMGDDGEVYYVTTYYTFKDEYVAMFDEFFKELKTYQEKNNYID